MMNAVPVPANKLPKIEVLGLEGGTGVTFGGGAAAPLIRF